MSQALDLPKHIPIEVYIVTGTLTPVYAATVLNLRDVAQTAILQPATEEDMDPIWAGCDWRKLWEIADFECEAIIKLTYNDTYVDRVEGLVRFALYPCLDNPSENPDPKYLKILNLETNRGNTRLINPIGYWLIWYAVQVALYTCEGDREGSIVTLDALEDGWSYYSNKVKMDELGWVTISPYEEGYAYRFTEKGALAFCQRLENRYGFPMRLDPC